MTKGFLVGVGVLFSLICSTRCSRGRLFVGEEWRGCMTLANIYGSYGVGLYLETMSEGVEDCTFGSEGVSAKSLPPSVLKL